MSQTLHILRKDSRYLRSEIALLAVTLAAYAWIESRPEPNFGWILIIRLAIPLLIALMIARLVHGESPRGDRQFWITRPYRWHSLLAAKLAFILVFVSLQIFLAQAAALVILGFPVASWLPLLIRRQGPILVVLLAIAAVAALTTGMAQFVLYEIVLLAGGLFLVMGMERIITPGFRSAPWLLSSMSPALPLLVISGSIALITLGFQYRNRRALGSLALAIAGGAIMMVALPFLTFGERSPVEEPAQSEPIRIHIHSIQPTQDWRSPLARFTPTYVVVEESGIPEGFETRTRIASATFEGHSGRKYAWQPGWGSRIYIQRAPDSKFFTQTLSVNQEFQDYFKDEAALPGTLRIVIEFELARLTTRPIHLESAPVTVASGLRCYLDNANRLTCQAPLRWPDGVAVGVRSHGLGLALGHSVEEPGLDLMIQRAGEIVATDDLAVTTEEHVGRFSRSAERQGVRPEDFNATR